MCCEIVLALGPMVCVCLGLVWCGCGTCVGLGSQAFGWWAYSLPLGLFLSFFLTTINTDGDLLSPKSVLILVSVCVFFLE